MSDEEENQNEEICKCCLEKDGCPLAKNKDFKTCDVWKMENGIEEEVDCWFLRDEGVNEAVPICGLDGANCHLVESGKYETCTKVLKRL